MASGDQDFRRLVKNAPKSAATLSVLREILAAFLVDKTWKADDHDVMDFYHAVIPSVYCDWVLLDRDWAAHVQRAQRTLEDPGAARPMATVVIPWFTVQLPQHGHPEQGKVHWLPPIADGEATIITLFFTAPGVAALDGPLIASQTLRGGSMIWLSGDTRPALPDEIRHWTELQAMCDSQPRVDGAATPDADIKGVIGGDMPDGSPRLLDLPIR